MEKRIEELEQILDKRNKDEIKDELLLVIDSWLSKKTLSEIWNTVSYIYGHTETHKILNLFLKSNEKLTLTVISRKCDFSAYKIKIHKRYGKIYVGSVRKCVNSLTQSGILLREKIGRCVYYSLNKDSPYIKVLLTLYKSHFET